MESIFPPAPSLFFQTGTNQQIPEHIVTSIEQDKSGFLWIGTANGLIRYDGYRFLRFSHQPEREYSLSGNFIQSILQRQNGQLWVSAVPGGISWYEPERMQFQNFDSYDSSETAFWNSVQVLAEDQQQHLWVGSRNGLARIAKHGEITILQQAELLDLNVRALVVDHDNQLWIGHRQGLFRLDLNQPSVHPQAFKQLDEQSILSLKLAPDGSIWVGTASAGVFWWQPDDSTLRSFPASTSASASPIYDFLHLNSNEIWLARLGGVEHWQRSPELLLNRYQPDPSDQYSVAHSDVRVLFQDNKEAIWLGSFGGGLQRFQRSKQVSMLRYSLMHQQSIASPNITSILELHNGDIWLGSRGAGIDILQPGKGIIRQIQPGSEPGQLQHGWVTAMIQHPDNTVWLATYPHGVYQTQSEQSGVQPVEFTTELNETVRRFLIDSQQQLWLGTQQGLYRWQQSANQLISYPLLTPQPQSDYINAITEDGTGQLWIGGGSAGLFRVQPGSKVAELVSFSNHDSPTLSILGLLLDADKETLWLDTSQGLHSIKQLDAERPELHAHTNNHNDQQAFGANLLQDKHGRLWTQQRLYDPATNQMFTLNEADGFVVGTPWFRAYAQTQAGQMLFGSTEGLLVIDADNYYPRESFPKLTLTSAYIDGNPSKIPDQQLLLEPSERGFSLEFAALEFHQPESIRYRYQLQGFDENWTEVDSSQRHLSYTNLWPGQYQLQIQSSSSQGNWSPEPLILYVTIEPKLWQQAWFVLLCLLLVTALLLIIYKARIRIEKLKARQLQLQVVRQEKELETTQKRLIEKEKMASLGQVVAGVAHELNTPIGIGVTSSTVLMSETKQIEDSFKHKNITNQQMQRYLQHSQEHLQLIIKNLARAADLVHHFKQVAVDQQSNQLQTIQLPDWLQERLKPYQLGYPGLHIELSCPTTELVVRAQALEQIVFQLLQNCCLHAFENISEARIDVELQIDKNECHLLVRDYGQGIPEELRSKVFEPFVTTKRGSKSHGHGLGLHLCYNLATQVLNGNIKLLKSDWDGSCFLLHFPRETPPTE